MREPKTLVSFAIGGLAIVNVALAVALWARSSEPTAYAQAGVRADIIAISARSSATSAGSIVMLDSSTGNMALMRPDGSGRYVKLVARRAIGRDVGQQ